MVGKLVTISALAATACGFTGRSVGPGPGGDDAPGSDSAPGQPLHLKALPGDTQVSLTWDPPDSAGSSPITGYVVTTMPDDTTLPKPGCMGAFTACTISGLTNGATYTIQLTAVNAIGAGPPAAATAMPIPTLLGSNTVELWLDAAASGTPSGAVGTWLDRSSHLRAAAQTMTGEQPVIDSVNGFSTITFDGADDYMVTAPFVSPSTTYTFFVSFVDRDPAIQAQHVSILYATRACGAGGGGGLAGWAYNSFGGNTTTRTPGAESPDAVSHQASVDGGSLINVPNGGGGGPMTAIAPGTWSLLIEQIAIPASEVTSALYLGAQPTLCAHGNVSIGELIVVSGLNPSSTGFSAVQSYVEQRWRIKP